MLTLIYFQQYVVWLVLIWCLDYNHAKAEHAEGHVTAKDSYKKKVCIYDNIQLV